MGFSIMITNTIFGGSFLYLKVSKPTIGVLIVTFSLLGFPYCNYSIMGPNPYSSYQGPRIRVQGLGFRVTLYVQLSNSIQTTSQHIFQATPLHTAGLVGFGASKP